MTQGSLVPILSTVKSKRKVKKTLKTISRLKKSPSKTQIKNKLIACQLMLHTSSLSIHPHSSLLLSSTAYTKCKLVHISCGNSLALSYKFLHYHVHLSNLYGKRFQEPRLFFRLIFSNDFLITLFSSSEYSSTHASI